MAITYAEQLQPFINFPNKETLDKHFNLLRKKFRFELTKSENEVLFFMKGYAVKFPGACKMELKTISEKSGYSQATVKRAIAKAVKLGILKRYKTRRLNKSRQGATVYQFQQSIELLNEPQKLSGSQNNKKPCDSKAEEGKNKPESPLYISPSLSFKDTDITKSHADKEAALKMALLEKLPSGLRGLGVFFDKSQDVYDLAGTVFTAKNKIDKSVRIEEHEGLFRKTVSSVYEYWCRQVRKGNVDYNVFGLMNKAIKELTNKIVDGSAYQKPVVRTAAPKRITEPVPYWMSVDKFNFVTREIVPDWMNNREQQKAPVCQNEQNTDLQAQIEAAKSRLANLQP